MQQPPFIIKNDLFGSGRLICFDDVPISGSQNFCLYLCVKAQAKLFYFFQLKYNHCKL